MPHILPGFTWILPGFFCKGTIVELKLTVAKTTTAALHLNSKETKHELRVVAVIVTSHQSLYITASSPRFALFSLHDFRVSLLLLFVWALSSSNKTR